MKCTSCQGALSADNFLLCPYCGERQEIDIRDIHFRNLGDAKGMKCPRCPGQAPVLEIIGLELGEDEVQIERCRECQGLFFNPGELESFLEAHVGSTLWADLPRMELIREEVRKMPRPEDASGGFYIGCPFPGCGISMNRLNFGRSSGVMIDSCIRHGLWLDGGELRSLAGWWHAGGKFAHQAGEVQTTKALSSRAKDPDNFESAGYGGGSWLNPLDCAPDGPGKGDLIVALGYLATVALEIIAG